MSGIKGVYDGAIHERLAALEAAAKTLASNVETAADDHAELRGQVSQLKNVVESAVAAMRVIDAVPVSAAPPSDRMLRVVTLVNIERTIWQRLTGQRPRQVERTIWLDIRGELTGAVMRPGESIYVDGELAIGDGAAA